MASENEFENDENVNVGSEYAKSLFGIIDSFKESEDFDIISKMDSEAEMRDGNLTGPAVDGIKLIEKMFPDRHTALNALCVALHDHDFLQAFIVYYATSPDIWDALDAWGRLQEGRKFE